MMNTKEYDILVLGSGGGGKFIAWNLAKQGHRVAVIERKYIGGSCPNIACLPSKNIIHSAKVASYFWRSEEFGITKDNCKINMLAVRERKRKMASVQVAMIAGLPYTALRDAILTHPTLPEGLGQLFSTVPPTSIQK